MKLIRLFVPILIFVFTAANVTAEEDPLRSAVVKIFAVASSPNYYMPWQNFAQNQSSASGFVISGNRIVTNAHAVAYQTFLTVRKLGNPTPFPARVVAVNHECDLALLTVNDPNFFDGITPLETAELPPLQSSVTVIGYPVGGDNVSVTSGVLSRIEPRRYSHSGKVLLAAQVDAAINPGNSGGPVVHDGKVVGIAFQGLSLSQNIGYLIPCSVLNHFLDDLKTGKLDGFPDVPFRWESMENPDLRAAHQMTADQSGVLVIERPELLKNPVPLEVGDVILAIDGKKIANDSTIDYNGQMLFFGCMVWDRQLGSEQNFTVLRDGKVMEVKTTTVKYPTLIPYQIFDRNPEYFIAGGMVFTPLTLNYMDSWNDFNQVPDELAVLLGKVREQPDQEVVLLSMVLADEVNLGYQGFSIVIVQEVNGVKINNLKQLTGLIDKQENGYLNILFQNKGRIILDINKVRAATARILQRYRIPSDRSLQPPEK